METKFRIEFTSKKDGFIVTKLLDLKNKFWIDSNSRLNNVKIKPTISQPRKLDENGNICLDYYVFRAVDSKEVKNFKVDEIVILYSDSL